MSIRTVLLWESTRREIREAIDEGNLQGAIVPTGSTEQHNEHLAIIHDTASVVHIAEKAALKLFPKVTVATPIAIGVSEHWMDHKGTLTLRPEIFAEVVYDVCNSLKRHGISNILILNGHAGNSGPIQQHLDEFRQKLGINLDGYSYWSAYTPEIVQKYMDSGQCPAHAAEFETSVALAAFPQYVHREGVDYDNAKLTISNPDSAKSDRIYQKESHLASAEKGQAMIDIAVDWVVEKMSKMLGE
ncbi:creatininase family protein [Candidatus Poribacteria bacterium]|nr:creatininase family protein [Candidatus Poribacteria bacterium]